MKKQFIIGGIILAVFITFGIVSLSSETTFEFVLEDSVSGSWVYNSTVRLQGRVVRGFKKRSFLFHRLEPGTYKLEISAPYYKPVTREVIINNGRNRLAEPISLTGTEIKGIKTFYVVEKIKNDKLSLEYRFAGEDGTAVANHPCLDVRLLCVFYEQLKGEISSTERNEYQKYRGNILFKGPVTWQWDTMPVTTYRYFSEIPLNEFEKTEKAQVVGEYLLLIPDPEKISKGELDKIVREIEATEGREALVNYLEQLDANLDYYFTVNLNLGLKEAGY